MQGRVAGWWWGACIVLAFHLGNSWIVACTSTTAGTAIAKGPFKAAVKVVHEPGVQAHVAVSHDVTFFFFFLPVRFKKRKL